jgi:hypothetical protein
MPSGWTPVAPDQQDPREGTSRVLPIGEERSFTSASSSTAPQCAEAEAAAATASRKRSRSTGEVANRFASLCRQAINAEGIGLLDCHPAEIALANLGAPQREDEPCGQAFSLRRRALCLVVGENMADDAESKVDEPHHEEVSAPACDSPSARQRSSSRASERASSDTFSQRAFAPFLHHGDCISRPCRVDRQED